MTLGQSIILAAALLVQGRLLELMLAWRRQDRKDREANMEWAQREQRAIDIINDSVKAGKMSVVELHRRKN